MGVLEGVGETLIDVVRLADRLSEVLMLGVTLSEVLLLGVTLAVAVAAAVTDGETLGEGETLGVTEAVRVTVGVKEGCVGPTKMAVEFATVPFQLESRKQVRVAFWKTKAVVLTVVAFWRLVALWKVLQQAETLELATPAG